MDAVELCRGLFHTGMRGMFPFVSGAISSVLPMDTLRWVSFGHVEADECGAMNALLAAAPSDLAGGRCRFRSTKRSFGPSRRPMNP